jgi:vacuolar-type H+-ATPase subunit C/Vma6
MQSGGVSGYAAIHSRVRVMYSELLSPQDGERLRDAADLPALVAVLKTTAYGPYLAGLDDKDLTARNVVAQLKRRVADVYLAVIHSAPGDTRGVAIKLFRHFAIANLKAVLRGIGMGSTWEQIQGVLFPLGPLSVIPVQQMLEGGNIETAVAQLAGTPYYETLMHAMKRYADEQSLFPLEVALDLAYWRDLWNDVGRLTGLDRSQALRVIGSLLDLNNLMWAMRYRVYYHLSEEEVINYTLPYGYHVRDADVRAVAAGTDIPRIVERLFPGIRNVEALLQDVEHGLPKLELQLQRRFRQQMMSIFAGYPFTIGLPLALTQLLELELQDLTVLVEAKSFQLPAEEYVPYLLMGEGSNEKTTA